MAEQLYLGCQRERERERDDDDDVQIFGVVYSRMIEFVNYSYLTVVLLT
jgi:hypothetical protein